MANRYRVIDLRTGVIETEIVVDNARSPEHAAREALGMAVVRSGSKKDLGRSSVLAGTRAAGKYGPAVC